MADNNSTAAGVIANNHRARAPWNDPRAYETSRAIEELRIEIEQIRAAIEEAAEGWRPEALRLELASLEAELEWLRAE